MTIYLNKIIDCYSNFLIEPLPLKGERLSNTLIKEKISEIQQLNNRVKMVLGVTAAIAALTTLIFATTIAGAAWIIPALILLALIALLPIAFKGEDRAIEKMKKELDSTSLPRPANIPLPPPRRRIANPFKQFEKP